MERLGLVASIVEQLEQLIGAGLLPGGELASELVLSRRYGVCRTTIREALRRLAARGLVVQHPGRRTRVVALDEALTLENLAVAMHGEGGIHPERRRLLLEGYFALKREATVELLADCRQKASAFELQQLEGACFALREAARWQEDWVEREFELLRLAAQVARRPGHLLLIQSLERAWRGIQARVRPHLDAQAVCQWAIRAMDGLEEGEDSSVLKRELGALLQACDERVLDRLAPLHEADATLREHSGASAQPSRGEPEPARAAPPEAGFSNRSACQTGSCALAPQAASSPELAPAGPCRLPECEPLEAREPQPDVWKECASSFALEEAPSLTPDGTSPGRALPRDLPRFEGEHAAPIPSGSSVEPEWGEHARRPSPRSSASPDFAEAAQGCHRPHEQPADGTALTPQRP